MLPNSGGCQNKVLFTNGLVGDFKVQMLASNASVSYVQITNALQLVKFYETKHFQSCRIVQTIKLNIGQHFPKTPCILSIYEDRFI